MDFVDFNQLIKPELLVLVPALNIIGRRLKHKCGVDKHIPLILMLVSVVLSCLWVFGTAHLPVGEAGQASESISATLFTGIVHLPAGRQEAYSSRVRRCGGIRSASSMR
jgi:hypothetical protein